MQYLILLMLGLAMFPLGAEARSLALTFDDGLDPLKTPQAAQWNTQLLAGLEADGITAMLFPSLVHAGSAEGLALVQQWSAKGHAVGNHTSHHRNLGSPKVELESFLADVMAADSVLNVLPTFVPMLRFPYLKEGDTREKRDGMRTWMTDNGYRSAPVSIDASDWYYNSVYLDLTGKGDTKDLETLKPAYLAHLLDRAAYYDSLAVGLLGRSPAHVLLLHTNAINANWLTDVLDAFTGQGWELVTPETAFRDPLYSAAPDVLPAGESIVWSLAREAGLEGLRYPAEDSVYEEPILRAAGLVP